MGIEESFPPFTFVNDQGQPDGFSVDLIRVVAVEMNIDVSFYIAPWMEVREKLENQQIDATPVMYFSNTRAEKVLFSIPYFKDELVFYRPQGTAVITSISHYLETLVHHHFDAV